jgi:hypothetical protein
MQVSSNAWNDYIEKLKKINSLAALRTREWVEKHGIADRNALIDFVYAMSSRYGEAAAELTCEFYDALALAQGSSAASAVPAETATISEVGKAVNGSLKQSPSGQLLESVTYRLCKQASADTMLQNASRDQAEYAWIPSGGETCGFCIALAANGWQYASKSLQKSHAEHIHANCDCMFCIRFDGKSTVSGYSPKEYENKYSNADTDSCGYDPTRPKGQQWQNLSTAKINGLRREAYAQNKDKINAQKREAYAKRKEAETND